MKTLLLVTLISLLTPIIPYSMAGLPVKMGGYILVRVPSKPEPVQPQEIRVTPAKVFERDGKVYLYFKDPNGSKVMAVAGDGKRHGLTDGVIEVISGTSRGDLLFFKAIESTEVDKPNPEYLGPVYNGGRWGDSYHGVFIDRDGEPNGQGVFLLIPTDLSVDLPEDTTGEQNAARQPGTRPESK
jgi:hypothetical protein